MSSTANKQDLQEIQSTQNGTAVIFIHGVLSSAEQCWQSNTAYWPDLLAQESDLVETGIYTFSYQTEIFSGNYSLGDAMDSLKEHLRLEGLLQQEQLIFVAHSMGGIVVREFLVRRQSDLKAEDIRIGLFLLASPSLGSDYANWITGLAKLVGIKNAQGDALRFAQNNTWLNDLDRNFQNLKESNHLSIRGKELIESDAIVWRKLLRKQIVEPFSGARYFGEPFKVPSSNHLTIVKPESATDIQHRLLCKFITNMLCQISRHSDEIQAQESSEETFDAGEPATPQSRIQAVDSTLKLTEQEKQAELNKICKLVKSRITLLLTSDSLLQEKLQNVLEDTDDCITALCKDAKNNLVEAMGHLTLATRHTLEDMKVSQQAGISTIHANATQAMNWLLLFAVQPEWLCHHRDVFSTDAITAPLMIHADSQFSADLGVSALQEKLPTNRNLSEFFEVDIPNVLSIDEMLESGPGLDAALEEIKQALWKLAFPVPKTDDSLKVTDPIFGRGVDALNNTRLNGEIVALRKGGGRDHYCMTSSVIMNQASTDKALINELLKDLPGLRVVIFEAKGIRVMLLLEDEIISCLRTLQNLILEYETP